VPLIAHCMNKNDSRLQNNKALAIMQLGIVKLDLSNYLDDKVESTSL
jgi:hypothetical protein